MLLSAGGRRLEVREDECRVSLRGQFKCVRVYEREECLARILVSKQNRLNTSERACLDTVRYPSSSCQTEQLQVCVCMCGMHLERAGEKKVFHPAFQHWSSRSTRPVTASRKEPHSDITHSTGMLRPEQNWIRYGRFMLPLQIAMHKS